ncbi:MAG: hypothetical protein ACYSUK_07850 [Planctomycetota bacterium]|jgi:hypothetical protein
MKVKRLFEKTLILFLVLVLSVASTAAGAWVKVDDRNGSASYSSGWSQTNPSTAYQQTATFTSSTSATVTYSFTGTQVRFYVWRYDTGQGLDVYIDDGFQETVNISSGSETSILAWESGTLSSASHTLRLDVVSGEPHIDAFEYDSGGPPDEEAPTPDPMEWQTAPTAQGGTIITMTAVTATDPSGVEYYFAETSGNPGGDDSGWQSSPSYTDTGLESCTSYTYQVKARDMSSNQNETDYSTAESITTGTTRAEAPEMQWHEAYNGSGEESHPHYVIETSDGGFLMTGETGFIPDTAKIYVVKTDSSGDLLWEKEFGSAGYNLGNGLVETPDANYVIAGTLNYDAVLIKVNASDGSTIAGWPKTWNLGTEDSFEAVENTQDGGLIATGYRDGIAENTFFNEGEGHLVKTDADGNQIWSKDISAYVSTGYRMKRISDGYIISGHPVVGSSDYDLIKVNLDGNFDWGQSYHEDFFWGFDIDAAGNMIQAGHSSSSPLSSNWDLITKKVDSSGDELWTRYTGQPRGYDGDYIHDEAWGARATADGGWLVVAGSGDEYSYEECGHPLGCSGQWIVYLVKYSSTGNLEWEGLYGGSGDWAGEDVCITSDGGALVANDCGAFGFTKIAPDDSIPVDYVCPNGVDFLDYSFFADYYGLSDCNVTNDCNSTDLDFSGSVDINDVNIFTTYWLFGKE